MKSIWKRAVAIVAGAVALIASCYPYYYTYPYYYDYAYYDPYYYWYDASYAYGWYDPYGVYYYPIDSQGQAPTFDLASAATSIAARAPTYFNPPECVNATASGSKVTYALNNCTGLFETKPMSGTVTVELSQGDGQLVFAATSQDLRVEGKPFVLALTGSATSNGDQKAMNIDSRSHSADFVESRSSKGTLTWAAGSNCITLNGVSTATQGSVTTTSTLTDLKRCAGQCPTSGTVTLDTPDGTFSSTFRGGPQLIVSGPGGEVKTFELDCR